MTTPTVVLHPVPEALIQLGKIGRSTLYAMIAKGEIGTVHIGNRVFVPSDEIDAFIERNRHKESGDTASPLPTVGNGPPGGAGSQPSHPGRTSGAGHQYESRRAAGGDRDDAS